jgi:phosphoribosylformylglycinamidine synthase
MPNFVANVLVNLKKSVQDPQGSAVSHALNTLGYAKVSEVRMGKQITVRFSAGSAEEAEKAVNEMCHKLLSNPVIETYKFELTPE